MNFFSITDQSNIKHNMLVIPLNEKEYNDLNGQCDKCMPSLTISSLFQNGHSYIIADFGSGGWKTAIALDEESEDGHRIGDELDIGEVLTVILTSNPNAIKISQDKAYLNVPKDQILAFSFLFTADIVENYQFYKMINQPKGE